MILKIKNIKEEYIYGAVEQKFHEAMEKKDIIAGKKFMT